MKDDVKFSKVNNLGEAGTLQRGQEEARRHFCAEAACAELRETTVRGREQRTTACRWDRAW